MGPRVELRGLSLPTLASAGGQPPRFDRSLPNSFEEIQQLLLRIERMDIEPDGYFLVAGGENQGARWQIDGHMFEYNGEMHRVEMHGSCDEKSLGQLLGCLGPAETDFVFQLVQEGVTLAQADFLRWAIQPPQ